MAKKKVEIPDLHSLSLEELASLRRTLAKRANQQIRVWERSEMSGSPSAYTKFAKPYLQRHGLTRFREGKKPLQASSTAAQKRREQAEINQLVRFINSPSYGLTGYKTIKEKAVKGFIRATGVDITEEQAEILLKAESFGWLKRTLGSAVLLDVSRAIAKGQSTVEEVRKRLDEMQSKFAESQQTEKLFRDRPIDEVFKDLGLNIDAVLFRNAPEEENPFDYAAIRTKRKQNIKRRK